MMYKYVKYNDIGLLRHIYSLLDNNDNLIHSHNIIHTNAGNNLANHLAMNDDFSILFKNSHTNKMKIKLQVGKVDVNKAGNIGFRIMNPYNNNILRVKHIKYLSEKYFYFFPSIIYMTEVKKYKLNNEEFNYEKNYTSKKQQKKLLVEILVI